MMAGELAPDQYMGHVPWDALHAGASRAQEHPTPFFPVTKRPHLHKNKRAISEEEIARNVKESKLYSTRRQTTTE